MRVKSFLFRVLCTGILIVDITGTSNASSFSELLTIAARTRGIFRSTPILYKQSRPIGILKPVPIEKTTKIANPCIDGIFQYGFASPVALTGFLNAVLGFKDGKAIEQIEYLQRDMPTSDPISSIGYNFIVDVRCKTRDGHHFLIEMQNDFRGDYHLKAYIEHCRMASRLDVDQLQKTDGAKDSKRKFWKDIQGIYTIVITNKYFSNMKTHYDSEPLMEPELVNTYELRHTQQLDRHYGDIHNQLVLLMLANLKATAVTDLSSPIDRWAYIFKDPYLRTGAKKISPEKTIEDPTIISGGDLALLEFMGRVNMESLPDGIREKYMDTIQYYNDSIVDIEEKAEAKGIEKGCMKTILEAIKVLRVDDSENDAGVKKHLSKFYKDLNEDEIEKYVALGIDAIEAKLEGIKTRTLSDAI